MNNQAPVTSRYVRNLIIKGRNNEFHITSIIQKYSMVDELAVGHYYEASLKKLFSMSHEAVGVTPEQAVRRALGKFDVKFR
jgi:hypothetical protein